MRGLVLRAGVVTLGCAALAGLSAQTSFASPALYHAPSLLRLAQARRSASCARRRGDGQCPGRAVFDGEIEPTEVPEGYSAEQLRKAYAVPDSGGAGQTIAIVMTPGDAPNAEADLGKYRSKMSMSPCTEANKCFLKRDYNGGKTFPTPDKDAAMEVAMDLEMASAACPECHLILVEAGSKSIEVIEAEKEAKELGATEISNSWGIREIGANAGPGGSDPKFEFKGIPVTAAAGDGGYKNHLPQHHELSGWNELGYPAVVPNVVAVGGTTLTPAPTTPRKWIDSVWPETTSGCSNEEEKPKWQGKLTGCESKGKQRRNVADVAVVAEGVSIYYSFETTATWGLGKGTSLGAPFVAGIYAHASKRVRRHPVEALYKDLSTGSGSILDVVPQTGLNNTNGSCSPSYLCEAVAGKDGDAMSGYDGPTGVGVPYGPPTLATWHKDTPAHKSGYFAGVSCIAADECTVVGGKSGEALAERWNGESWTSETVPNQPEATDGLASVSCPAVNSCVAVGDYSAGEAEGLIAERWNGSSWTRENPVASGFTNPRIWGISCTSASACTAVGHGYASGKMQSFALRWNGSEWVFQSVPSPAGAGMAVLDAVACATASECYAAGWEYVGGPVWLHGFVEKWTEGGWEVVHTLSTMSSFEGISCPAKTSCTVVGESEEQSVAESWDGSSWSPHEPPRPVSEFSVLQGISCVAAEACIAAGLENYTEEEAIIDGWNGTAWESQPNPEGLGVADISDVSCADVADCVAVGYEISGGSEKPLVVRLAEDESGGEPEEEEGGSGSLLAETGATPTAVRDSGSERQALFFADADGEIGTWEYSEGTGWSNSHLASNVLSGTNPAAATNAGTHETVVFYVTAEEELAAWSHSGESWEPVSLGGSVRAGTSPTVVVDESLDAFVAYYVNASSEVAYWGYTEETGWVNGTVGGAVKGETDLSVSLDKSTGDEIIYYVNTSGELAAWVYTGGTSFTNIEVGGSVRSGTSPATATNFNTSDVVVYYVNTSGEIAFKYYEEGWKAATLGGAVRSGSTPTVVNDLATGGQTVDYITTANEIGYWYFAGSWSSGVLSGESAAASGSPTLLRDSTTGDQWLYYVGEKGDLWTWTLLGETLSNSKVE